MKDETKVVTGMYIGVAAIAGILLYFLLIGGVLIWPLINIIGYLKVLIYPRAVRKKYGSNIVALSKNSFDQEITEEVKNEITNLVAEEKKLINSLKKLESDLAALGELSRNKDGSISQRSNAGKKGQRLTDLIASIEREIYGGMKACWVLENKPHSAWDEWSSRYGRYLGNRDSIIFMIVGFPIFFATLANFNLLELRNPTFVNIAEIYIYIVFVAPMVDVFDISLYKEGAFSLFISYNYAVLLSERFNTVYTLYNWMIVTLTMPLLTLFTYFISRKIYVNRTKIVEPEMPVQRSMY